MPADPLGEAVDLPTPATSTTSPAAVAASSSLYSLSKDLMGAGTQIAERRAQRMETGAESIAREAEGLRDLTKVQASEREAARPTPPTLPTVPKLTARPFLEPGDSVLGQLQSVMQGIGLVALGLTGSKGRGYAYAATAALKGAAEGWQQGDAARVQNELNRWKVSHESLMSEYQLQRDAFNDLLTNQKMTMDNRLALLRMRAEIMGLQDLADQARQGNIAGIIAYLQALDKSALEHEKVAATIKHYAAQEADRKRAMAEAQARSDRAYGLSLAKLGEMKQTRDVLLRDKRLKELEPFQKAGKLADGLNELERIYTQLETAHPELVPQSGELFDAWSARAQRFLKPGDTSLAQLKMLWNQVIVGLLERGWADEKGVRALAVFQSQINIQDQMPPPEALHAVMKSIRGLVRKGVDRDLEARSKLGYSPEELAIARTFVETLREPEENEMLGEIRGLFTP